MNKELLIRYLLKETSQYENIQVENWLEESDENRTILEDLYFIVQVNDKLKLQQSLHVEEALVRFKKRVNQKEERKVRPLWASLQGIAVALFLPLLAFSIYLYFSSTKAPESAGFVEMKTNSGMVSSFSLPDGSTVWLNSNSSLRYPSSFDKKERVVEIHGQAYFEVVKNTKQPFIVKTKDNYSIEVLGTSFNIAAYDDENIIETTLVSGSVKIKSNDQQRILVPNEKAVFVKSNQQLEVTKVDSEFDILWRSGQIKFKNHSMDHVLRLLSRQYNVTFQVEDKRILSTKLTAAFDNEQLPQILVYLRLASGIKFNIHPLKTIDGQAAKSIVSVY